MLDIIKTRRSTRSFAKKEIPSDVLNEVLEAGRFAPSGCNVQTAHFLVIQNKEVLNRLAELVRQEFAAMEIGEDTFGSIAHSITASRNGTYTFHYDPDVLIVVANSLDNPNSIADTSCSINSMMLMANELDLGSCWINQLRWLNEDPVLIQYLQGLGMKSNERVYGSLALGYPATEDGKPLREPLSRFGNEITYIK